MIHGRTGLLIAVDALSAPATCWPHFNSGSAIGANITEFPSSEVMTCSKLEAKITEDLVRPVPNRCFWQPGPVAHFVHGAKVPREEIEQFQWVIGDLNA